MATENQYEFFRYLYEEENSRYSELESRAKLYITIISLYMGALAFKLDDVLKISNGRIFSLGLFIGSVIIFSIALLFSILAIRIRVYEGITDPYDIFEEYGDEAPIDQDFFDNRIADLAVATDRNSIQNDIVAARLSDAAWFLYFGVICHIVGFMSLFVVKGAGG